MAQCRKCGAEIVFISLPSGKVMPCDADIIEGLKDPAGKDTLVTDKGEIIRCWIGQEGPIPELTVPVNGRQPHWATCPFADEFRKKND